MTGKASWQERADKLRQLGSSVIRSSDFSREESQSDFNKRVDVGHDIFELATYIEKIAIKNREDRKIIKSTNSSYDKQLKKCKALRRKHKRSLNEMVSVVNGRPTRKCIVCGKEKSFTEFTFNKRTGNHRADCKKCYSSKMAERYNTDPKHNQMVKMRSKKWRDNRSEETLKKERKREREYRENNRELIREQGRKYRRSAKGKEVIKAKLARRQKDPQYKFRISLSKHVREGLAKHLLTKKDCNTSTMKLLGCSMQDFTLHIESQFVSGMTWENYGHKTWHLDHIIPLSSFDLTKEEQRYEAFSYKNYQPLFANEEGWKLCGSIEPKPKEYNLYKSDFIETDSGLYMRGRDLRKKRIERST